MMFGEHEVHVDILHKIPGFPGLLRIAERLLHLFRTRLATSRTHLRITQTYTLPVHAEGLSPCATCGGWERSVLGTSVGLGTRLECAMPWPRPKIRRPTAGTPPLQSREGASPAPSPHNCISWNRGHCIFMPNCKMQHICASCKKAEHRTKECPTTADDAPYKQPYISPGGVQGQDLLRWFTIDLTSGCRS